MWKAGLAGILAILIVALFWFVKVKNESKINMVEKRSIKVNSPTFSYGEFIPRKYTCDGENVNPPLEIEGVPKNAKSLVLIVDDPDAPIGTFTHWLVWNINPSVKKIEEKSLPEGAVVGRNDFGKASYGGPCPPSGAHRYFFRIYALDKVLNLSEGAGRSELEKGMKNHILAFGELMGKYSRK